MKCMICGRSTLPGAKLCSDCRAARKRAFAATVTQPLLAAASKAGGRLLRPSQSVAATVRRAAEQSLFVKPVPAVEPALHHGINVPALAAALGVMVAFGAYSAHRVAAGKAETPGLAAATASSERQAVANAPSVTPTLTALTPTSAAEPAAAHASSTGDIKPELPAKRSAKPRAAMTLAPATPIEKLAAVPAIAPLVEAAAAPTNPWQAMSESLAQCTGDLLDRVVCDLRVRQQYCNGYWGKVPQCPGSVATERGQ